jgi:AAA domain
MASSDDIQVSTSARGEGNFEVGPPDNNDDATNNSGNSGAGLQYDENDEAYDEGLLVDDDVQELNLKSNSFSAIIIYSAPLGAENSLPAQPRMTIGRLFPAKDRSMSVRIRFNDDEHGCHITLRFIYDCFPINSTATVRLPFKALYGSEYSLQALPDSETAQYLDGERLLSSEKLYSFTINGYRPDYVSAQNLFVTSDTAGIFDTARAALSSSSNQIACVIVGTHAVPNAFSYFQERIAVEQELATKNETSLSGWYPDHKTKVFIQAGDYPPSLGRPCYPYYEAKHSFFNKDEYLTVHGFGIIAEHEWAKEQTEGDHYFQLKLAAIPGGGSRRYFGLLVFPAEVSYRLNPGDKLSVNFEPDVDSTDDHWHTTVLEPLPYASAGEVTVLLTCPWDKETHTFRQPNVPLHIVKWSDAKNEDEAFELVANAPLHKVLVRFIDSDKHFKRQLNTLRLLPDAIAKEPVLQSALLANNPAALPSRDLFGQFRTVSPNIEQEIGLSARQADRVRRFRTNEGPLALLQGPPGTGKTYVACRIALAFLKHPQPKKVMIVSAMNASVDSTTLTLKAEVNKCANQDGSKPLMIIRLHTLTSEIEISEQPAKQQQPPPSDARPALIDDADLAADLAEVQYAEVIHNFYHANTTAKRPHGIADDRIHLIELSLGTWMLRVAGLIESDGPFNESAKFEKFCDLYNQFSRGNLPGSEIEDFRARAKELREFTIKQADAIACTLSQCADPSIHAVYQPTLVIVEEAARAVEVDCIMPLVFYKPLFTLLVGDDKQMKPTVFSMEDPDRGNNIFAVQLHNSLFTRLHNAGYHCPILDENRRMQPEVAKLIETQYYRKEGLVFITPVQPEPEVAGKVIDFNQKHYRKPGSYLWLDVPQGRAVLERSRKSKYNAMNAAVDINLAIKLLEDKVGTGDDIVILAPYHAQYLVLSTAIVLLRRARPDLPVNGLCAAKIDSFQGSERRIVICDLVIDSKVGFMKVMSRLNVGLSRSRCGLYIVGNIGQIEKGNRPRNIRHLQSVINYCKKAFRRYTLNDNQHSPFVRVEQLFAVGGEAGVQPLLSGWDNNVPNIAGDNGGWDDNTPNAAGDNGGWDDNTPNAAGDNGGWDDNTPNITGDNTCSSQGAKVGDDGTGDSAEATTEDGADTQNDNNQEASCGDPRVLESSTDTQMTENNITAGDESREVQMDDSENATGGDAATPE